MRLDYAGISVLSTGACFPPFVYGFYCQPMTAAIYLSMLSVVSAVVFFVNLFDWIHTDKFRHIKGYLFLTIGVAVIFPVVHLISIELNPNRSSDYLPFISSVPYFLAMGACYLGGLYIYIQRIPEKCIPGKVDNCGNSHNFWHMCVNLAIFFHYFGMFENYYTRVEIACNV
mmetsp:Transcript_67047/g.77782  ORF Transcript_67047/g.77782 Transcript_67047/m.77782 type:complete len:171 (-) Transcript_67047:22-534(-)